MDCLKLYCWNGSLLHIEQDISFCCPSHEQCFFVIGDVYIVNVEKGKIYFIHLCMLIL